MACICLQIGWDKMWKGPWTTFRKKRMKSKSNNWTYFLGSCKVLLWFTILIYRWIVSSGEIDIKNRKYYFFDGMINIKSFNPNKIKIDKQFYKIILIYYIGYVTPNSVKSLYLVINKINEYVEKSNRNEYSTLVPTDESKDTGKIWTTMEKNKGSY